MLLLVGFLNISLSNNNTWYFYCCSTMFLLQHYRHIFNSCRR